MTQKPKNHNNTMPSYLELQNMLKNLKLTEIKENIETERIHTQKNQFSCSKQLDQSNSGQYTSIIFDNFEDPNCFQEQIKALDVNTLQRNIEKKPIIIKGKNGEIIAKKFKIYMQTQKSQTKTRKKIDDNCDKNQDYQCFEKSIKKSSPTLNLKRQKHQNKENIKLEVNKPKILSRDPQEGAKRKIFSNIQMHKFSDCQQLIRGVYKK